MRFATDAELAILGVLWERGPSSVREVHVRLYSHTDVGYTTALRLLQNMLQKGLVTRNESSRQHIYAAAVPKEKVLNSLVRTWIDKIFAGSSAALAVQALDAKTATRKDLLQLKRAIREMERRVGKH